MSITLQSSLGNIKVELLGNQEEVLQAQVARFLQQMARTGQNGNGAAKRSANGHTATVKKPRSAPAEIIGRTGYPLYRN